MHIQRLKPREQCRPEQLPARIRWSHDSRRERPAHPQRSNHNHALDLGLPVSLQRQLYV